LNVIILTGFAEEGKRRLIRDIVRRTPDPDDEARVDVLLFELAEGELGALSEQDDVEIREMEGGCPCCTLEGDLRKMLRAGIPVRDRSLIIETGGGCDLQRMKAIIHEESPSSGICSVVVMESPTMKVVLEVVPVMAENIDSSDLLVVTGVDGSSPGGLPNELKDVVQIQNLDPSTAREWGDDGRIIPFTSAGNAFLVSYLGPDVK
jgi:G3E family GTPase